MKTPNAPKNHPLVDELSTESRKLESAILRRRALRKKVSQLDREIRERQRNVESLKRTLTEDAVPPPATNAAACKGEHDFRGDSIHCARCGYVHSCDDCVRDGGIINAARAIWRPYASGAPVDNGDMYLCQHHLNVRRDENDEPGVVEVFGT